MSEEQPYQVGQIVNGHVWTGTEWLPIVNAPTASSAVGEPSTPGHAETSQSAGAPVQSAAAKGGNWFSRHKGLTAIAALLIIGIAIAASGGNSKSNNNTGTPAANTSSVPAASPTATDMAQSQPTPTPTPTPAVVTPILYHGTGDKVLSIKLFDPATPEIMKFTNVGDQNNVTVYELDAQLQQGDLAVNTIGSYAGTVLINKKGQGTTRLQIQGAGKWTVTLLPLSAAARFSSAYSGRSDNVLIYTGPLGVMTFVSRGTTDNVTVDAFDSSGNDDLAVNDIGAFSTQHPIQPGPILLAIQSSGSYSISVSPA